MEPIIVAVIVALPAMLTPIVLALIANSNRRQEKREDYARQDAVAAKADKVALQAAKAADLLASAQKEAAAKADEAARLLLVSNERVARTAAETSGQLTVIHTLVNSNMTTEMQENLDSKRIALALMLELIELKKAAGVAPSEEVLEQVGAARGKIKELEVQLADRLKQSNEIAKAGAAPL